MTTVPSPCRQLCRLDARGEICLGCFRTLCEIATWSSMAPDEQRATLGACAARRQLAEADGGPTDPPPSSLESPGLTHHDPTCLHE